LSFLIFATSNIKNFIVRPIDELFIFVLENLEPSGVGAPDLHVVGFSSTLDVPGLVVVSGSDGQRLLVEVPDLGLSTVWCFDDHVSVVDQVKISVVRKCRHNVEVSLNIESESLIELTLCWLSLPFINIDDVPLLMNSVLVCVDTNVSVFVVKSTLNLKDLSFFVHNSCSLVSEHLPPP